MRFLKGLTSNTERLWFQENKHRYEEDLLGPAPELTAATAPGSSVCRRMSQPYRSVWGSRMWVYKDPRLSRNTQPIKPPADRTLAALVHVRLRDK